MFLYLLNSRFSILILARELSFCRKPRVKNKISQEIEIEIGILGCKLVLADLAKILKTLRYINLLHSVFYLLQRKTGMMVCLFCLEKKN